MEKRQIGGVLLAVSLALGMAPMQPMIDTAAWDRALQAHAREGGLDYEGLARDREGLDRYLETLREAEIGVLSRTDQLAFWINAYNAVVADFVLSDYPDFVSVKEVSGFFDREVARVAGQDLTLDEIEGRALEFGDPRVHFAVVCASTSCPDLRGEAFRGDRLDEQLEEQTLAFLTDSSKGLRFDEESNDVHLSSIFKWYAGDFTGGSTVVAFFLRGDVLDWVADHVEPNLGRQLKQARPAVKYLPYDWSLNDR